MQEQQWQEQQRQKHQRRQRANDESVEAQPLIDRSAQCHCRRPAPIRPPVRESLTDLHELNRRERVDGLGGGLRVHLAEVDFGRLLLRRDQRGEAGRGVDAEENFATGGVGAAGPLRDTGAEAEAEIAATLAAAAHEGGQQRVQIAAAAAGAAVLAPSVPVVDAAALRLICPRWRSECGRRPRRRQSVQRLDERRVVRELAAKVFEISRGSGCSGDGDSGGSGWVRGDGRGDRGGRGALLVHGCGG